MKIDPFNKHGLEIGDLVTRIGTGIGGDNFTCHELSFGKIVGFQTETKLTRPKASLKFEVDEWVEVVVLPFDREMAPDQELPLIQWGPEECVKLTFIQYIIRILVWPISKFRFDKPINGRNTDF